MTSKTRHDTRSIQTAVNLFHDLTPLRIEYLPPHGAKYAILRTYCANRYQSAAYAIFLYLNTNKSSEYRPYRAGVSPKCHRSIAHIPSEYRRKSNGVSAKDRKQTAQIASLSAQNSHFIPTLPHPSHENEGKMKTRFYKNFSNHIPPSAHVKSATGPPAN